jgi:hypothetical protein
LRMSDLDGKTPKDIEIIENIKNEGKIRVS